MKKILFTILFLTLIFENIYSQHPVISFKAEYYRDFEYTPTNDGVPSDTDVPIKLTITRTSWGLPDNNNNIAFPYNSLIPTEIQLYDNRWYILNGDDGNGKRFDFQAVPIEVTSLNEFKGIVSGNANIGYGKMTRAQLSVFKGTKSQNWFVTSGKNGMDLGTGMANIKGDVKFGTVLIDETRIDDYEPDFLFTQIANPGGNYDKMEFVDENGVRVGITVQIRFDSSAIPDLGGTNRFIYFSGTNGEKILKMVAFRISDFGIDKNNYERVRGLKYTPSGESDVAFIAADRQSIFVYKKLDASISGSTIACKDDPAHISFRVASEDGKGPYKITYKVTKVDGSESIETFTSTDTGPFIEAKVNIPTNTSGIVTYKLMKVEDTSTAIAEGSPNKVKNLNEVHRIEIKDCDPDYYVTTWNTTQDNESITIPIFNSDSYRYTIKWQGIDSNNSLIKGEEYDITEEKTLTLSKAGRYRVRIRGIFPRIYFNNNSGDKNKILTVEQWGTIKWKSQENAYFGCENLQISATDVPNLSITTSLKNMFKNAYSLNSDISTWTVTTITNMEGMFDEARSFNQNLASWDMSAVTNVNNMFRNSNISANKLGLTLAGWKTKLTNLSSSQTLGANLRYCNGGTALTVANLTMPTEQCATLKEVGEIYLETTNTANNRKRLAGILPNRAFEWLEEDVKVEGLTDVPSEKGAFKLAKGNGEFDFNGIKLNINKQVYSKNNPLRGFTSLDSEGVYPLANMKFSYKKGGNEDGFSFSDSEIKDTLTGKILDEEGIIVYSDGHFYESIKVNSENKPSATGTLKWVRIDN